jgi:UDP-N-acetyl-D-glucosamine dehydrogenase
MGINIWEVIDAAKTKPYGFQAFYPGPGLGGHCIPLDPYYLSWRAKKYDFHISLIETSGMINDGMPEYCVERAGKILNRFKKALNGSKVLILGVAYKQDIDDYRESPALKVIEEFEKNGSKVDFYDPYVSRYKYKGRIGAGISAIDADVIKKYDIVVITTAHTNIDYEMVAQNAAAVFDTKNAMKNVKNREKIELL